MEVIVIKPNHKAKRKELFSIKTKTEYNEYLNDFMLSDDERNILDLFYINGYSYSTIERKLSMSIPTIKNKMNKILDKLC